MLPDFLDGAEPVATTDAMSREVESTVLGERVGTIFGAGINGRAELFDDEATADVVFWGFEVERGTRLPWSVPRLTDVDLLCYCPRRGMVLLRSARIGRHDRRAFRFRFRVRFPAVNAELVSTNKQPQA